MSTDNLARHTASPLPTQVDGLIPAHQALHNNFVVSMRALRRDLVRAAYYLLQVRERQVYRALGYRKISDYARDAAGLNPRQCRDFLFLAKRLPDFPAVKEALGSGDLTWSKARLICTVAPPEEQEHWVDAARSMNLSDLEKAVVHRPVADGRGSNETKQPRPKKEPVWEPAPSRNRKIMGSLPAEQYHYVTLKFSGDEYARWERLVESARQRGELNQAILHGLKGKGGGEGQGTLVVIMHCPECGKAVHPSSRGEIEVPKPVLEAGLCDAILEDPHGNRRRMVAPKSRRLAFQRARYTCEAPGCGNASFLQIHHRMPVAGAGGNDLDNLMVLCSRCHRNLHEEEKGAKEALRKAPL